MLNLSGHTILSNWCDFSRVNCFNTITPQTPFGGYKESGIGREMWVELWNMSVVYSYYDVLQIKFCGGDDDENRISSSKKFLSSIDSIYPNIRHSSFTILVSGKCYSYRELPICSCNFCPRVFWVPWFLKDDFGFIFAPRVSRTIVLFIYQ